MSAWNPRSNLDTIRRPMPFYLDVVEPGDPDLCRQPREIARAAYRPLMTAEP
jgi:hypothetical protein